MTLRLFALLAACLSLMSPALAATAAREGKRIQWSMGDGTKHYRLGDLTATFAMVPCAPRGEECEEGDADPVITIARPGADPVRLDGSPMQNFVTFGRLEKNGPVVAMVQTYSGGMHCCQLIKVVVPDGAWLKTVDLGGYDGEAIGWPRDVDGDEVRDFVLRDDRFLYAFESYAASWSPPLILNIRDGGKADVSAEPRYAKRMAREDAKLRKACTGEEYPNGACAAWAAVAARRGQLDAVWPVILAEYRRDPASWPDKCKVERDEEDGSCPDGQLVEYPDYPTGLRAFLVETGYIAAP